MLCRVDSTVVLNNDLLLCCGGAVGGTVATTNADTTVSVFWEAQLSRPTFVL
jgi:hypothetical protein